jgi:hypothetical protein
MDRHPIKGTGPYETLPTLPGLVVSQTWQYQGQTEKMTVPMVFSF